MGIIKHVEKSVVWIKYYYLDENKLDVSFERFRKSLNYSFILSSISRSYKVKYVRFEITWLIPAVLIGLVLGGGYFIDRIIDLKYSYIIQLVFGFPLIFKMIMGFKVWKLIQFEYNNGTPAFGILISHKSDSEFVVKIVQAIEGRQKKG